MTPTPETTGYLQWFATLGVGGVLAAFMFLMYRKDQASNTETIKGYTELWRNTTEMLVGVIKDNTASNVRLIGLIETMERNQARKDDLFLRARAVQDHNAP